MWVAVLVSACRVAVFMYGRLQCLCMEGCSVYVWRVDSMRYFGRISY